MATPAAFERQTKVVPYVLQKSQTVDNVLPPQRRWHAVEIFQTVIVQEEKPETLSDFFDFHPVVSPTIVPATLKKIPRPSLIARSFEPHARKATFRPKISLASRRPFANKADLSIILQPFSFILTMKSPQTKTKTAKTSAPLSYLDTSVLRQLRFGHPEQKKALITSIPAPH